MRRTKRGPEKAGSNSCRSYTQKRKKEKRGSSDDDAHAVANTNTHNIYMYKDMHKEEEWSNKKTTANEGKE